MTKKKLAYEAPKTETQELRFEGGLLLITSNSENNPNKGYDNGWDLGSI